MLLDSLRGLRSCVFPGMDMPGRRTETIDDDDEEIYEYLEEKLLSPTTLSELHLPLLGVSVPNEKFKTKKKRTFQNKNLLNQRGSIQMR